MRRSSRGRLSTKSSKRSCARSSSKVLSSLSNLVSLPTPGPLITKKCLRWSLWEAGDQVRYAIGSGCMLPRFRGLGKAIS